MSAVNLICRIEPLRLDPERLATLYVEMGEHRAHRVVSRAMRDLDQTIAQTLKAFDTGSVSDIAACADRVERIAEPLGLSDLARVAADVIDLCDNADVVALAAVLARMQRVAGQSARMVCTLSDMSG